jgi:hypothetical protein
LFACNAGAVKYAPARLSRIQITNIATGRVGWK